jgi:hypothetical protein
LGYFDRTFFNRFAEAAKAKAAAGLLEPFQIAVIAKAVAMTWQDLARRWGDGEGEEQGQGLRGERQQDQQEQQQGLGWQEHRQPQQDGQQQQQQQGLRWQEHQQQQQGSERQEQELLGGHEQQEVPGVEHQQQQCAEHGGWQHQRAVPQAWQQQQQQGQQEHDQHQQDHHQQQQQQQQPGPVLPESWQELLAVLSSQVQQREVRKSMQPMDVALIARAYSSLQVS